jgi:hypothetical protein
MPIRDSGHNLHEQCVFKEILKTNLIKRFEICKK